MASPFNTLASFQAINDGVGRHPAANANVFLYDSATSYTGPVVLLNGQKLIGQDATSSLAAISGLTPGTSSAALPSTGGGSPNKVSITATGNDVTLGSGNTVWGMTLGNATSGIALSGGSVGSLKIRDLTINTTGPAVSDPAIPMGDVRTMSRVIADSFGPVWIASFLLLAATQNRD
ncbi:MAG TPA: hypothetical protein VHR45_07750 [Thermoanaerobaculia bacterium]|nr:hypothetical protein [Thermoanaerobaculia bacterium]